jgi:hypothetical protein
MSTVALHFSSARCALATSKCIQKNIEIIALKDASRIGKTIRVAQARMRSDITRARGSNNEVMRG